MKMISDEMINKYLDNEMSDEEIKDFNEMLKSDNLALDKLKAARLVEQTITKVELSEAPAFITEKVMSRVNKTYSVARQKPYFFYAMISVFLVAMIGTIGALALLVKNNAGNETELSFLNKIGAFLNSHFSFSGVVSVLESNNFLILGTALIAALFITAKFMVDSHKNFKHKFNGAGH